MSCCGDKRSAPFRQVQAGSSGRSSDAPTSETYQSSAFFEYSGLTALTVLGPVTGRRYRFERPGAVLEVDLRDRPSLLQVPRLRQVPHWQRH